MKSGAGTLLASILAGKFQGRCMFDQPQLMAAVLAALAFAIVLVVFAISIRFADRIMRGRRRDRPVLRFGRGRRPEPEPENKLHEQQGENRT